MLLYIHIPFCDSKCHYCAFNSYVDRFHLKETYMISLQKQLENDLKNHCKLNSLESVFIGGGTPSCIKASLYENIFKTFKPYLKRDCEITTEANPNSATKDWLETMSSLGVTRVSFGVQSFNEEKLKKLGRNHNKNSAIIAIQNAVCIGFNGINCDIIYGVQGDCIETIKEDISLATSLGITHLSAYSLVLEEGTKFYNKSYLKIDDEELSYEIFAHIKEKGLIQYEISNFAKSEDFESKHNFGYWEHKEYLGVGAGAVGYIDKKRTYTLKGIEEYINEPFFKDYENLSEEDIKIEQVLLGFRCKLGVKEEVFNQNEKIKAFDLTNESKLFHYDKTFYNKNYLLADELALYILD